MRRAGTIFRGSLLAAVLVILVWIIATAKVASPSGQRGAGAANSAQSAPVPEGQLLIPVAGIAPEALADTYTQGRAQGARRHDAIDIAAPRGTPVVAAADGQVEKLFFSPGGGGITAYLRSPDRQFVYYYAHLDAFAPGLREGLRLRRGEPVGTVGSTGNADPAGPHLHFAIHVMAPADRWWQGRPINPYPLLAGGGRRR